jgi:hypothetical protein
MKDLTGLEQFRNSRRLFRASKGAVYFHPKKQRSLIGSPGRENDTLQCAFGLHQFRNCYIFGADLSPGNPANRIKEPRAGNDSAAVLAAPPRISPAPASEQKKH